MQLINRIKKRLLRHRLKQAGIKPCDDIPEVHIYHGVRNDNAKTIRQQLIDDGVIQDYPDITISIDENGERRITTQ